VARAKRTSATAGLSEAEVRALTLEFGKNELPEKKKSKILQVRTHGAAHTLEHAAANPKPARPNAHRRRSRAARGSSSATCGARCRS